MEIHIPERVSYFSNTLQVILEAQEGSRAAFAERIDIPQSTLHTYVHGKARPDLTNLEKICWALTPVERADLVIAHLRDEVPANAQDLVRIVSLVDAPAAQEAPEESEPIRLPSKIRRDFDYLMRRAVKDPSVGEWIHGNVEMLRGLTRD